ncbi:MAG: hypothetical protein U1E78_06690 [Gammaproteobacteria bacterium]
MNLPKRIKPVFKCPTEYKSNFSNSHALLTISVGQEVHEGEKFEATIELINNTFNHITILVDDVLQRHSMGLISDESPEWLYQHSLNEGDLWLERNKPVYTQLTTPYTIIRWEKWLHHEKYESTYSKIKSAYLNDPAFRAHLDQTASTFLDRFTRRQPKLSKDSAAAFNACLDYLFEECAALCLWIEGGYHFEVYPSQRNEAMSITHQMFVAPNFPEFLWPVAIKFKNRKQLSAQKFSNTDRQVSNVT